MILPLLTQSWSLALLGGIRDRGLPLGAAFADHMPKVGAGIGADPRQVILSWDQTPPVMLVGEG